MWCVDLEFRRLDHGPILGCAGFSSFTLFCIFFCAFGSFDVKSCCFIGFQLEQQVFKFRLTSIILEKRRAFEI